MELVKLTNLTIEISHASCSQWGIQRKNCEVIYETAICLNGGDSINLSQDKWMHMNKQLGKHRLRKKRVCVVLPDFGNSIPKSYRFRHCQKEAYNASINFTSDDYDKWQKCFSGKVNEMLKSENVFPCGVSWYFHINAFAKQARLLHALPTLLNANSSIDIYKV